MRHRITTFACLIAFAVLLITAQGSRAQSRAPLATALGADGSVRSNVSGSFDPTGYRMTYGPNGEPKFVSASQPAGSGCADSWDTSFTMSGTDISIATVVSDASGNVYIGGWFETINGMPASGIAKWNGTAWSALGSGLSGPSGAGGVQAIAISGTDVYVGGDFTFAGGAPALHVAKWNGTSWSAMGSGLGTSQGSPQIYALAVSGTNVYAGGQFQDGNDLNYIARWDGSAWVSMGTGMNSEVRAIAVLGTDVYAGGSFTMAGGNPASRMAKWNGTAWSAMQAGTISSTLSIAISGTDIYIGTTSGLLKYNGTDWTQLGTITNPGSQTSIRSIVVSGSDIYVGGAFTNIGGTSANRIAKFNGTSWSALGSGVGDHFTHFVTGIAMSGGTLFTGGFFPVAGGVSAKNIATWNGSSWSSYSGTGLTGEVLAIAVSGTDVYVGGSFLGAGPLSANRIAKWNSLTNTWSALGTGVTTAGSTINTIAVVGDKVYAGGNFTSIGGVSANRIAVWDGATWARLGTSGSNGVDGPVFTITPHLGNIYVGGSFLTAAGQPASRIARWNGTSWSGLNSSGVVPSAVTSIVPSGNDIYVGSSYTLVDGPNYFLKYDGTNWTPLGTGMTGGSSTSLAVDGGNFYAAGGFTSVGGVPVARIAKWNGSVWSALGSGVPGNSGGLFRIAMSGSDVIAVGDFLTTQGAPFNYITKWNGSAWTPLGTGLNGIASAVAVAGGDVFVGGLFTRAGCNTSPYFARWRETLWTGSTNTDWHTTTNWGGGSVPTSNQGVTISTSDAAITSADVTVSNLVVTGGRTLTVGGGRTLTVTRSLDLSDGSITGTGALIVNGDLTINSGALGGLGSLTVTGELNVRGGSVSVPGSVTVGRLNGLGGNLTAVTPITVNGDLNLAGGTATATTSIAVGGSLNLSSGTATGGGAITVTGNAILNGGAVSSLGSLTVNGNLSLTGGNASNVGSVLVNGNLQLTTGKITGPGTVTIPSCSPSAVSGGSSTSLIESPLVRCVNSSGTFIFPVGTGSTYSPVELSNVTGNGNFTVEPKAGAYSGAASGLPPNRLQRWWQLTNGGIGQADVVFNYVNADIIAGSEIRYRVYRISGGTATRVASSVNISTNRATMLGATSFAAFTMAHTDSVPAMFAGRLTTASGRGAANQLIQILDEVGNPRFAVTNPFGYYRFPDTPTIRTYRLRIRSKRYGFPQGEITIQFDDASSNIDFVATNF